MDPQPGMPETDASAVIAFLSDPLIYPDKPAQVEIRETHMSRVFLTAHYAYKMKKPVSMAFLDYSTLAARQQYCEAELRLNRRLAASIYLDVVPVCLAGNGRLRLGKPGRPVEWLVQMRRLPASHMLDQALVADALDTTSLKPVAQLLARFYHESIPTTISGETYTGHLQQRIDQHADALRALVDDDIRQMVDHIASRLREFIQTDTKRLHDRARRIVDGHGDLRPEHVAFGSPPAIIDCIEFNQDYRLNDPLNEIAFLDMECRYLGNDEAGEVFLEAYCMMCEDFAPARLMAFYRALRALLRAKLALWHLQDYPDDADKWHGRASDYLKLAVDDCDNTG